jgi:hypothetical protein
MVTNEKNIISSAVSVSNVIFDSAGMEVCCLFSIKRVFIGE